MHSVLLDGVLLISLGLDRAFVAHLLHQYCECCFLLPLEFILLLIRTGALTFIQLWASQSAVKACFDCIVVDE